MRPNLGRQVWRRPVGVAGHVGDRVEGVRVPQPGGEAAGRRRPGGHFLAAPLAEPAPRCLLWAVAAAAAAEPAAGRAAEETRSPSADASRSGARAPGSE